MSPTPAAELAGFTRDLDRDLARPLERIAQRPVGFGRHAHSSLVIHVAFFERASMYSAVAATAGATSLRSMAVKPSFSPK